MSIQVETPPALTGESAQQLKQVYAYLYRLSENLNVALNNLDAGSFSSNMLEKMGSSNDGSGKSVNFSDLGRSYKELRSLILNTAEIIHKEMDEIYMELESKLTAISGEWGTYQENIEQTISITAKNVVQSFNYDAQLETLQEAVAGFSEYQVHTEGFIKSGFINEDEYGIPVLGIAIGQSLSSVTVTVNGEEYTMFKDPTCAFYTSEKVSFYVNGVEVAYLSNEKLYIHDVEITGSVELGGKWKLSTTSGLMIQWIGG